MTTTQVRPVGPVDILVVGLPTAELDGTFAQAVVELVRAGTVRVLDMVLVAKDTAGEVTLAEVTDLDGDGIPDLVAIRGDAPGLLTDADARAAVAELPAGTAVAMVAWENTWAIKAGMALRRKGAVLLGFERIPADDVAAALDELEAEHDETES